MTDIAAQAVTDSGPRHGPVRSAGTWATPPRSATRTCSEAMAFIKGIGRQSHYFTASSQDTSNRLAASQFLVRLARWPCRYRT